MKNKYYGKKCTTSPRAGATFDWTFFDVELNQK